jgi:glycosyltransferase involved in cell wall biosynthesis
MARIVFVTQQVDPKHPALAATIPKLEALAARLDEVVVLADRVAPGALPDGCRARTFGARTKAGRGARFEAALAAELRSTPKPAAIVAHMAPVFAVLASPLARLHRVKLLLWYTHWHASPTLRLATRLVDGILSVDTRSFPLASSKVRGIGHGIRLEDFPCRAPVVAPNGALRAVALGRYSRAKGLETVLRAVRIAADHGEQIRLRVHGPALTAEEQAHRRELEDLRKNLSLGELVELGDALPRSQLPALFAGSDVLVNNMRAGAPDKVVYEAAAACLPVIASNPVFDELLDRSLRFEREDPAAAAGRLRAFAALAPEARASLGRELHERVARNHSVETWADGVLEACGLR